MKEDLLYYIWQTKSFDLLGLQTIDNQNVKIIDFGQRNIHSGPDFSNCKVEINNRLWAGSVEFHVKSSDWIKHNHQNDDAYKNVILHVVYEHDKEVIPPSIPTLELKPRIDSELIARYAYLQNNQSWIPCETMLDKISSFTLNIWLDRVALERLEVKSQKIIRILESNTNDWEETFYILLSRYLGTNANREAFELLSQSLPLKTLLKNVHQPLSVHALLFGQAGFLEDELSEEYFSKLKAEFNFLRKKYNLTPLSKSIWKTGGVRPSNSPQLRIAQLAEIIINHKSLFSSVLESENPLEILDVSTPEYWDNHYYFGNESTKILPKRIGKSIADILAINAFAPSLYTYGKNIGNDHFVDKAIRILEVTKSEKNSIITKWKERKIDAKDALQSQALIHLKQNYCAQKRCMSCSIGHRLLKGQ